jgi:hypothetical protein
LGQKSGTNTPNLDISSEPVEKISREDIVDNSQGMVAGQAVMHDIARGGELDNTKPIGDEVDNMDKAGFIGPGLAKAQTRKPTWKKRARACTSLGDTVSNANHVVLRGKRALRYERDYASAEEEGNRLKKARSSGEVINHDSVSVVAVEQRRRSQ